MSSLDDFSEILKHDEPLGPLTWLKVGGAAKYLARPRSAEELTALVRCCFEQDIPVRLLGGGSNLLIRDEGVDGLVLQLDPETFGVVAVSDNIVTAGGAAPLSHLVSTSVQSGLSGFESLVGIPGTVGGALHGNAGGNSGGVGQFVRSATVVTVKGETFTRTESELSFSYRSSSLNELAILEATFELKPDNPEAITQRTKKNWIMKKATQPLSFQSAGCIFKNPRGMSAGALIEQCGLKGTKVGNASISERHANFVVTSDGAKSNDVLELIETTRQGVAERFGVDLDLEIRIW